MSKFFLWVKNFPIRVIGSTFSYKNMFISLTFKILCNCEKSHIFLFYKIKDQTFLMWDVSLSTWLDTAVVMEKLCTKD